MQTWKRGDPAAKAAAYAELHRFYAAARDWPDDRFDKVSALAFVVVVGAEVGTGQLAGDSDPLQKARRLAARDRLDNRRTMLAATYYGTLQQQGHLHEVASDGLGELQWLCAHSNHPHGFGEATLASIVIDACGQLGDWSGVAAVASLLPCIEQRLPDRNAGLSAARAVMLAQCRFLHALTFGQPERAGRCLEVEEQCIGAVGDDIPFAASMRLGVRRDGIALALANEDFGEAERLADQGLQEVANSGLADAQRQAYAERMRSGLATARIMLDEQVDDGDLIAAASPAALLQRRVQRAWIAFAHGDRDRFQELARLPPTEVAACQDAAVLGKIWGLRLQAALARRTEAEGAERSDEIERIEGRLRLLFEQRLASISALPSSFGGLGLFHFEEMQQLLADLVDAQLALQPGEAGVRTAMATVLHAEEQGSLTRTLTTRRGASKSTWNAVQDSLPADAIALVFVPSRYGSILLSMTRRDLVPLRLPPCTAFDELAWQVTGRMSQLRGEPERELVTDLRRLRDQLLPPTVLARLVPYQHWIVVGSGALTNVPFEALPLDNGTLVGERYAVSNIASLPLRALLAPEARPKVGARLLMIDNLAPAAIGRAEFGLEGITRSTLAGRIAPLLAPYAGKATELSDERGTEAALRALQLRDYDIVHILAHGARDASGYSGWGIALGGDVDGGPQCDGLLWPEDVLPMHARGLVILSACRIARAPRRLGEDHGANLGGAFLYAGASAVVQSRAAIRVDETLELMQHFHARLAEGKAWAEALRAARAAIGPRSLGARLRAAQVQLSGWSG